MSHTDRECPQGQVQIHSRDSASIDFDQASGRTASKNFWIEDIDSFGSNLLSMFAQLGELAA